MKYRCSRFVLAAALFILPAAMVDSTRAAERPTVKTTCDPRPDIWSYPLAQAHVPYRRQYNRPRYWTGWVASKIAPSSQEALVWCENVRAGSYEQRDMPPRYKRYFAPKPWEVLTTGARPAGVKQSAAVSKPPATGQRSAPVPAPVPASSSVPRAY